MLTPKNTAKYELQFEFMTKHCVFSLKVYPGNDSFSQPLVAMAVTFAMSGGSQMFFFV